MGKHHARLQYNRHPQPVGGHSIRVDKGSESFPTAEEKLALPLNGKTSRPRKKKIFFTEAPHRWWSDPPQISHVLCTTAVLDEIRARPPQYFVSDDLGWLEHAVERALGEQLGAEDLFLQQFRRRFTHIRAYHGCRTENVGSYFEEGIRPLSTAEVIERTKAFFLSGRFPEITPAIFERAEEGAHRYKEEPKVWFGTHKKKMLRDYGHYALYGSEKAIAIAFGIHTATGYDYRQALKLLGKPTLIVCDIPIDRVPHSFLKCYTNEMLVAWLEKSVRGEHGYDGDGAFPILETVDREYIVRVEYPEIIADPFRNDSRSFPPAPWQR
jgi:hypothetical protein